MVELKFKKKRGSGSPVQYETIRSVLLDPRGPEEAEAIGKTWGVSAGTVRLYKRLELGKAQRAAEAMRVDGEDPILWPSAAAPQFTPEQVAYIRTSKLSSSKLALQAGCSSSMIRMIRTGKAYA